MKALRDLKNTFKDLGLANAKLNPVVHSTQKHETTLLPPKMVIRATADYVPESPHELSFHKGDFFYVHTSADPGQQSWIEACNPATDARGYVPLTHFEIISRTKPRTTVPLSTKSELNPNGLPSTPSTTESFISNSSSSVCTNGGTFATMKFDFKAELPHELSAKEGEGVFVMARSNDEWLVAKPLEYLSAPGLIPTSYITFRDMRSGQALSSEENLSVLSGIPSVYEWSEQNKRYCEQIVPLEDINNHKLHDSNSLKMSKQGRLSKLLPATPHYYYNMDDYFSSLETINHSQAYNMPLIETTMPRDVPSRSTKLTLVAVDHIHMDEQSSRFCVHLFYTYKVPSSSTPMYKHHELLLNRLYSDFVSLRHSLQEELASYLPLAALSQNLPSLPPGSTGTAEMDHKAISSFLHGFCALPDFILQSSSVQIFLDVRSYDQCHITTTQHNIPQSTMLRRACARHIPDMYSAPNLPADSQNIDSTIHTAPAGSDTTSLSDTYYHRIKIIHQGDTSKVVALRVPSVICYDSLMQRIEEKLGTKFQALQSTETSPDQGCIQTDEHLQSWLDTSRAHGKKLILVASPMRQIP